MAVAVRRQVARATVRILDVADGTSVAERLVVPYETRTIATIFEIASPIAKDTTRTDVGIVTVGEFITTQDGYRARAVRRGGACETKGTAEAGLTRLRPGSLKKIT